MTPIQTTVVVVVVIAALIVIGLTVMSQRSRTLRKRFGPEYDKVLADQDSRTGAEHELRARERRHAELELRPLCPESRSRYATDWTNIQARFVDVPKTAVTEADKLVTELIAECGYPTTDYADQLATLSVEHATTLQHYRDAHEINLKNERGVASTEELRQALVHYRALFSDLLGENPVPTPERSSRSDSQQP